MAKINIKNQNNGIILMLIIIQSIQANSYHEYCPKMCLCDTYNDLNRANCR